MKKKKYKPRINLKTCKTLKWLHTSQIHDNDN